MRAAVALGVALVIGACASMAAEPSSEWSGVYQRSFDNGLVSGETYRSTDSLLISGIDEHSAVVEIGLSFYNGHQCAMEGIFQVEGEALVYREPETDVPDYRGRCEMRITRVNGDMMLSDENGNCRETCGARGGYDGATLPISSHRPLTAEEHVRMQTLLENLRQERP
jgi:hypothetical protein